MFMMFLFSFSWTSVNAAAGHSALYAAVVGGPYPVIAISIFP